MQVTDTPVACRQEAAPDSSLHAICHKLAGMHASSSVTDPTRQDVPHPVTDAEALAFALAMVDENGEAFMAGMALRNCWMRLPRAQSPEIALSLQRLITALTTVCAWCDWATGARHIKGARAAATARDAARIEREALAVWQQGPAANSSLAASEAV